MAEEGYRVTLNVYDLSQGLARQISTTFLGKAIEGIWHTGVVVYGTEYFFGGGIQSSPAGTTQYGAPLRVIDLGVTHIPKDVFESYLQEISPRYTAETYSLLSHNCNNFTNEVAQFLVGVTIPEYILNLPNEVLNSPMGPLIMPMIQNLETTLRSNAVPQVPQFKPPAMAQPSQVPTNTTTPTNTICKSCSSHAKPEVKVTEALPKTTTPASVPPAAEATGKEVSGDPLGSMRSKVQEEISSEFAAIMATGTLRASEAAALATRRVMQRYGHLNVAAQN